MTTIEEEFTPQIPDDGELRTFSPAFELRDVEDQGEHLARIYGRAVPYNTPTDIGPFIEEFRRGAFDKSINTAANRRFRNGRGLPLTLFHRDTELDQHIGAAEKWEDRADGLYGLWNLDTSTIAQEAARMARDGFLNFLSIRFHPGESPGDTTSPAVARGRKPLMVRNVARLVATSLVSTPAYADSTVEWVRTHDPRAARAAGRAELRDWQDTLERLRAGA